MVSLVAVRGAAGVEGGATEVKAVAQAGDPCVRASFPFKNPGRHNVSVTSVTTDCDCVTATSSRALILPGEAGSIEVAFSFGERTGAQEKRIQVTTSDAPLDPTTLLLSARIASVVECSPRVIHWRVGDEPVAKAV